MAYRKTKYNSESMTLKHRLFAGCYVQYFRRFYESIYISGTCTV